jgi:hypothetical protein
MAQTRHSHNDTSTTDHSVQDCSLQRMPQLRQRRDVRSQLGSAGKRKWDDASPARDGAPGCVTGRKPNCVMPNRMRALALRVSSQSEQFRPAIVSRLSHHGSRDEHSGLSFRSSELSQPI